MSKYKILAVVFFVIAAGMSYYLYASIKAPIERAEKIEAVENAVIERLKVVQEAEIAFYDVNGRYAKSWDELKNFMRNGTIYNIVRRERILDVKNYLGQDSIVVTFDTLSQYSAYDSLFSPQKYPDLDIQTVDLAPGTGAQFELYGGKVRRPNGVELEVFEVKDTRPYNPERRPSGSKPPLTIGSRTKVTTSGNWK